MSLAGCGSSGAGPTARSDDDGLKLPPVTPCPGATVTASTTFPEGESSKLPHPPSASDVQTVPVTVAGVNLIRYTSSMSLGEAVQFVEAQFPKAGWILGDGDSELHEADIPFSNGTVHGTLRLGGEAACTTTWLLATVTKSGTDLSNLPGLGDHDGDTDGSDTN